MTEKTSATGPEGPVEPLVGRFPTSDELRRQFQARMWREYAMAWDGRRTTSGVERNWVANILQVSRAQCLHRARTALTPEALTPNAKIQPTDSRSEAGRLESFVGRGDAE